MALRVPEAKAPKDSYEERGEHVRAALKAKLGDPWATGGTNWYIRATYEDKVIVEVAGDLKQYSLTWDAAGDVTLGDAKDAEVIYKVVSEGLAGGKGIAFGGGVILGPIPVTNFEKLTEAEKKEKAGLLWAAVAIESGVSQNRNYYPESTLRAAASLYEGAKVFINHELRTDVMRDPGGLVGRFREAKYATVEGTDGKKVGAVVGTLKITSKAWRERMLEAWEGGEGDLYGLSHTIVNPEVQNVRLADGPAARIDKITAVESLDIVSFPSAGGRLTKLVAGMSSPVAITEEALMKFAEKLAKLQEGAPDLAKALSAQPSEAEVDALLRVMEGRGTVAAPAAPATPATTAAPAAPATPAAVVAAPAAPVVAPAAAPHTPDAPASTGLSAADRSLLESVLRARNGMIVESALNSVTLPAPAAEELREALVARNDLTPEIAREAVEKKVAAVARLVESIRGIGFAGTMTAEVTGDKSEKLLNLLDDLLMTDSTPACQKAYEGIAGRKAGRPDTHSIKEAYVQITGDVRVYGKPLVREGIVPASRYTALMNKRLVEGRRIVEGTIQTTTWAEIFGDSVARRMLAEYRADPGMDAWRIMAAITPLNDFRTQRRIRWGGYGDLPSVLQNDSYTEAVTPGDEEATYAAVKRGYIEAFSWEAMVNDDLGQIRAVPVRMGRAAARTLFKFVTITNCAANPVLGYDAVALYAAGHNNIITTALSQSNLETARQKLADQTDMSTNEKLNLYPKWLMVPTVLESLGWRLVNLDVALVAGQNATERNFLRATGLDTLIVNPYLTDANDYFVGADKGAAPFIELGFLFGREEPVIVIADQQNVGDFFLADKQRVKIQHVYGGAATDHRATVGGIVP